MKKFALISLSILFALSSCSKLEDLGDTLLNSLSAEIDGDEWSAVPTTINYGDKFIITATSLSQEVLIITINGSDEGVYKVSVQSNKICAASYKTSLTAATDDIYSSLSGTCEITEIDEENETLTGNFEFSMVKGVSTTPDLTIENGTFSSIKYRSPEGVMP